MIESDCTFNRDLTRGKYHEKEVLKLINRKYNDAYIVNGYCKEWDIFIPKLGIGIEVKSDEKSKYTGNIVVEVEFDGKPSALTTTKAEWWVWFDGNGYKWFKVSDIIRCINDNNLRVASFIGKGDAKSKKAYLIKKDVLYKYAFN